MRTFLRLKNKPGRKLPQEFRGDDVRYAQELVATFLQRFTAPGDVVLDPFAGFGTTLIVAEAMDRAAYGVEYDPRRARYTRSQLARPERLVHGDSRRLLECGLPPIDFSITSPPFTERDDHDDPFTNYSTPRASYNAYLHDIEQIYAQVRQLLKPGAHAVIEVSNLKGPSGVTTLAWDVARAVGQVLDFEGEIVIGWDSYAYGYDHSYCLVFRRPPE
jgi:SAM-dependent methyltransferase